MLSRLLRPVAALAAALALGAGVLASPTPAAAGYCSSYSTGSITTSSCYGDDGSSSYGSSYRSGNITTGDTYGQDSSGRSWSASSSSYDWGNGSRSTTINGPYYSP